MRERCELFGRRRGKVGMTERWRGTVEARLRGTGEMKGRRRGRSAEPSSVPL